MIKFVELVAVNDAGTDPRTISINIDHIIMVYDERSDDTTWIVVIDTSPIRCEQTRAEVMKAIHYAQLHTGE